jgi:ABC-type protease/lipase transport system fused ATPase/permease subunit
MLCNRRKRCDRGFWSKACIECGTLKSLAIEPLQRRVWDDRSAQSVAMGFRVEKISATAQSVTGLIEKLMSVAIIGFGALDVFNGAMTVGALVAFNMLAGRVSGPLVHIVTMVHEYQETRWRCRFSWTSSRSAIRRDPACGRTLASRAAKVSRWAAGPRHVAPTPAHSATI